MHSYLFIKWSFPEEHWEQTKQINTLEQFHLITGDIVTKFGNKIIPFMREGDKCYHLVKHAAKIKTMFQSTQQKQTRGANSNKSMRRLSISKVHDIQVEFRYAPEHKTNQAFKKMEMALQKTSKELSIKIDQAHLVSYYNNIRIEKKKSYLKSDTNMKNVKIWFLISEPLVYQSRGEKNEKIIGSLKEEIKIHEHKQLIKQVHDSRNWSINLSMERIYLSWQKLCTLVKKLKQNESQIYQNSQNKEELHVLHIYTQIYTEGTEFYVSLQADYQLGGQCKNVSLTRFIEKLNEIPNLYTIILIGPNMRALRVNQSDKKKKKKNEEEAGEAGEVMPELKQLGMKKMPSNILRSNLRSESKQWHKMTNVPIVAVGVYDVEKDLLRKHFMRHFYLNLFRRKSIVDCFESTKVKIKQLSKTSHQNITNCCCMHPQHNQPIWDRLVNSIGNSTIHKIFKHNDTTVLKDNLQNSPEMFKELISFVLGLSAQEKGKKNLFRCLEIKHNAYREKEGDILLFNNKFGGDYLPVPADKEHWEAGGLILDEIKPSKCNRYRPLVIYEILQQITRSPRFHVLAITGSSKSGKSMFIEMAESFLTSRGTPYVCQHFKDWLKHYRTGDYRQIILNFLREVQRQQRQLSKKDNIFEAQIKLIIVLEKINYEIKEEFEKFIKSVSDVQKIRQANILFLAAISETSEIRNKEIKVYKIPPITDLETKYFILRDENIQLNYEKHVVILKQIMDAFEGNEGESIKNEIQFTNFCKQLNRMISQIYSSRKKPEERKKTISQEIQKYITKTNTTLNSMRVKQAQNWEDIGFLCSFKECFYLCDFNQRIALSHKGFIQELSHGDGEKGFFFRIFEQSKCNSRQQKSILIQPEMKCHQYFVNLSPHFLERKIDYFFNFYYLTYMLIKNNSQDKVAQSYSRILKNLGIFMYEYETMMQQLASDPARKEKLVLAGLTQTEKQRQYIYNFVLERHIYTYIQYLKQINMSMNSIKEKQKLLYLVVYSMLLASICHKYIDAVLGEKKEELNHEIQRFILLNQHSGSEHIQILLSQIGSLVYTDENIQKFPKQQADNQQWNIANILRALKQYELVKQRYQRQMQRLSRVEMQRPTLLQIMLALLEKIQQSMTSLKLSIESGLLEKMKKDKHYECILDLLTAKVMIKYHHFNNEEGEELQKINPSYLKKQFDEIEAHIPKESGKDSIKYFYGDQVIQVCYLYLKVKINVHLCKDSDIKSYPSLPHRYQSIYNYLKQKLNPKTLFKNSDAALALFMKAGCLKVNETSYNFVRVNNMIASFLSRKLSSRNMSMLFLNLSVKNFQMLAEEAPHIHYFVLSTDCIVKKNNLEVIFEDSETVSAKFIDMKTFGIWLHKIRAKFLILVGSKSAELYKQVSSSLSKENICVICLTLNKVCPDLSTYPYIVGDSTQPNPLQIVNSFIKAENSRRVVEMTICGLITQLAQQKEIYVSYENVQKLIQNSIDLSKKVVKRWYHTQLNISDAIHQITYEIYVHDHQTSFPQIRMGELKNLTSQMVATPYNFEDDAYYESIGRINYISEIMKKLSAKGSIIEIAGGNKSGKTQILKQVAWFCQTRSIFQLGVYRYDIKQLVERRNLQQILNHLDQQSLSKQYLLILLDNLEPTYISSNISIFSNFFFALETKPVSLIYTIQHEPRQKINSNQYRLVNEILEDSLREGTKKYELYSFDINQMNDVDKICIVLVNLRKRSIQEFGQIFHTHFPSLCDLRIKTEKTKDYGKPKPKRKEQKNSRLKRIKSQQKSLEIESQNLPQKLMRNKSLLQQSTGREVSCQSEDNSDHSSDEYFTEIKEERDEQSVSDQLSSSVQRKITSVSSSPLRGKSGVSDLNNILRLCQKYKQKMVRDDQHIYEQNYIRFDIEQMIQELEYLSGVEIEVWNPMFFQKYETKLQ